MANVFKLVAHLTVKIFILEKEKGRGRNQKANIPQNRKIREKTAVKKVHQQKRAAPLTEKIGKEIVRVADGFLEKAARSKVRLEKEIERQVLGNEGMARTQAQQLKGKGWKMCLETRKRDNSNRENSKADAAKNAWQRDNGCAFNRRG